MCIRLNFCVIVKREARLKQLAEEEKAAESAEATPTKTESQGPKPSEGIDLEVFKTIMKLVNAPNPWGNIDPKNRAQFLHIKVCHSLCNLRAVNSFVILLIRAPSDKPETGAQTIHDQAGRKRNQAGHEACERCQK